MSAQLLHGEGFHDGQRPQPSDRAAHRESGGQQDDPGDERQFRSGDRPGNAKGTRDQAGIQKPVQRQPQRAAQQHTPGGVGDRFGRHHAGQLAAAHADGAQRAVLAGAGGYPQADSIHDMEHRDRHDHREEPVNQHREGIIQPRCLSIPLYFIMLHLYLDGEVNLPLQLSGLDRPKRNKF